MEVRLGENQIDDVAHVSVDCSNVLEKGSVLARQLGTIRIIVVNEALIGSGKVTKHLVTVVNGDIQRRFLIGERWPRIGRHGVGVFEGWFTTYIPPLSHSYHAGTPILWHVGSAGHSRDVQHADRGALAQHPRPLAPQPLHLEHMRTTRGNIVILSNAQKQPEPPQRQQQQHQHSHQQPIRSNPDMKRRGLTITLDVKKQVGSAKSRARRVLVSPKDKAKAMVEHDAKSTNASASLPSSSPVPPGPMSLSAQCKGVGDTQYAPNQAVWYVSSSTTSNHNSNTNSASGTHTAPKLYRGQVVLLDYSSVVQEPGDSTSTATTTTTHHWIVQMAPEDQPEQLWRFIKRSGTALSPVSTVVVVP